MPKHFNFYPTANTKRHKQQTLISLAELLIDLKHLFQRCFVCLSSLSSLPTVLLNSFHKLRFNCDSVATVWCCYHHFSSLAFSDFHPLKSQTVALSIPVCHNGTITCAAHKCVCFRGVAEITFFGLQQFNQICKCFQSDVFKPLFGFAVWQSFLRQCIRNNAVKDILARRLCL